MIEYYGKIGSTEEDKSGLSSLPEGTSHTDFVNEVMGFLCLVIVCVEKINSESIDILYTILVKKAIMKSDSNYFFKFLREANDKKLIDPESYVNLFNNMVNEENLDFLEFNLDLLKTIWNIFLSINISQDKVKKEVFCI